jgi:hypothetical protein
MKFPSEPPRILELRPQDDPANVARLVRSALREPGEPVPRLKSRIRYTMRRKSVWRRRYVRLALVGGVIFLTGGVVGAVVQPVLRFWQQRKVESVENIYPAPPAAHARHRRTSTPPPHVVDEGLRSPDQPAEPSSLPAALAPLPPQKPARVPAEPTVVPAPARAEPVPERTKPVPARVSLASSVTLAPARGQAAKAAPARHPGKAPMQTAMLEPPPRHPEQLPPPGAAVLPATPPSTYPALLPPPPSLSPPPAEIALPPAVAEAPRPAPIAPALAAPQPPLPPPPSEQALLSRAVRSLRSEHRPESALAVLDEYVGRFPSGSLLPEATRLRTEALLALGQKRAALVELNREDAAGASRGEESRLVRGELRAAAGRWQGALEDFDAVVRARLAHEPATSAKLRERFERALWGRASARSHLGDDAGARADLHECLRRFPRGRFAARAARLLGELR